MEDIKVYIHGRPNGQDIWPKDVDAITGNYLGEILNWTYGKSLYACMIIDHLNGDAYYTYIHRKNVSEKDASRQEAYCAITLRIAHKECQNVATLYELLKAAYEQLVGKAIQVDDKGYETFLITKFLDIEGYLLDISKFIFTNFESYDKLKNSLFPLQGDENTNVQAISYALQEVDSPVFKKNASQNRILVSEYLKPKMNALKEHLDKLKIEKESLQTKLANISDQIDAQYKEKLVSKEAEIKRLNEELQSVRKKQDEDDARKNNFYSNNVKDINDIIKIARQMAGRFPESTQESVEKNNPSKHQGASFAIPEVWYRRITLVLLTLLLVCSMVLLFKINNSGSNNAKPDNPTEQLDTVKTTDSSLTIHIAPSPVDNKLIVNTQYQLSLSDEDLECKLYYEDNQGEYLLDNDVLCPKTPNSHIKIKAVVDNDTVAISEFYTIDAAKNSNKGTADKGTDAAKTTNKGTAAKGTVAAKTTKKGTAAKGTDAAKTSKKGTAAKGTDAAKATNKGTTAKGTDAAKTSNKGTAAKGTDATKEIEVSPQQPK